MIRLTRRICISPLVFVLAAISLLTDTHFILLISYTILCLHEIAHYHTAKRLNVPMKMISIYPFGISIRLEFIKNPITEMKVCMAGPLLNFVLWLLFVIVRALFSIDHPYFQAAVYINLALLVMNLLPIIPLDGGRIYKAALVMKYGFVKANRAIGEISIVTLLAVIILGILGIAATKFNIMACFTFAFLITSFLKDKELLKIMAASDMLLIRKELNKEDVLPVKQLVVHYKKNVYSLFHEFGYSAYYIVLVKKNSKIIGEITETELFDAVIRHNITKGSMEELLNVL